MKEAEEIMGKNPHIPFTEVSCHQPPKCDFLLRYYTDAAGKGEQGGIDNFKGIGTISMTHRFAFQIPETVCRDFLVNGPLLDSTVAPGEIIDAEFLGQNFTLWYITDHLGLVKPNTLIQGRCDNTVAETWCRKGRARYEGRAALLRWVLGNLKSAGGWLAMRWINTTQMKIAGADYLSRNRVPYYRGLRVVLVNHDLFKTFTDAFLQACFSSNWSRALNIRTSL